MAHWNVQRSARANLEVLPGVIGLPEKAEAKHAQQESAMRDLSDVERLLARKADVNQRDSAGQSALCVWAVTCHAGKDALKVGEALLAAGADIDGRSEGGFTALMAAAVRNQLAPLQLLLDFGANTELVDDDGRTALHHARDAMCAAAFKALDAHSRATRKITILAAAKAVLPIPSLVNLVLLYEMVGRFIDVQSPIHVVSIFRDRFRDVASHTGSADRERSRSRADSGGARQRAVAFARGHRTRRRRQLHGFVAVFRVRFVTVLLCLLRRSRTVSCRRRCCSRVRRPIAPISSRTCSKRRPTPTCPTTTGLLDCILFQLSSLRALFLHCFRNSWTPLHCCADLGEPSYAKLLLLHRADANARTNKGKTALDVAKQSAHSFGVVETLKRAEEIVAAAEGGVGAERGGGDSLSLT